MIINTIINLPSSLIILATIVVSFYVNQRLKLRYELKREQLQKKLHNSEKELADQEERIKEQQSAIQKKEEKEYEYKWHNEGLARFSDILSKEKDNLEKLSQRIITNLVEYVGANQGNIFLANDNDEGDVFLESAASYAPAPETLAKKRFYPGEGQVGICFKERKQIVINNLPEDYTRIGSGLGETSPKHLLLIPLQQDGEAQGVIELASFNELENYKIRFIEKLAENIISVIITTRANDKTNRLLEESKRQSEELRSAEEELRQNLEEMQATHDELQRQKVELEKEKALMDAMMNYLPDYIYFKDTDCKFVRISQSMLKLFPVDKLDDMIGKSDFDFQPKDIAQKYYNDEQKIMKDRKGFIDDIQHEIMKNGVEQWVSTTKLPLINKEGKVIGLFGITKDITKLKKAELDALEQSEEMKAQEEMMKVNIEEMKATQEELQRQQEELAKEQALMDTLLKNAKESIYFKDIDSRFIKASYSMAEMFKVKNVEELYGKTDFDFFDEEHAKPAFNDEMRIIRSGKPLIDKLEKETFTDGREKWVSTSKMPLRDQDGNIIGTFGISKNITNVKEIEKKLMDKEKEVVDLQNTIKSREKEIKKLKTKLNK